MKKYILALIYSLILVSCKHKEEEIQFVLPDAAYVTSGEATAQKKEFVFPAVPYAR